MYTTCGVSQLAVPDVLYVLFVVLLLTCCVLMNVGQLRFTQNEKLRVMFDWSVCWCWSLLDVFS